MAIGSAARALRVAVLSMAFIASCDSGTEPHGGLFLMAELPARAVPGWKLADTVAVRSLDADGNPRAEQVVTWSVTGGGGTIEPLGTRTNADGIVRAVWTLGPSAGENTALVGDAAGSSLALQVTGEAFRADSIAAGASLGCGLVDGAIWCWGQDPWVGGEAVSIPPDPFGYRGDVPGRVSGPADFVALAVSSETVCGLDAAGAVLCASSESPVLAALAGLPTMRAIDGASWGANRFCGLAAADSTAWCWVTGSAPAAVEGSPAFIDIDVEGSEGSPETEAPLLTCGIRADSTAACWGLTSLGNGSSGGSSTPVAVSGGHHFAEIAVLMGAACGLTAEGAVWCWGRNTYGQLGVDGGDALTPILSAQGVEHIGASQDAVVVTDANGVVRRWGGASSLVTTGPIPTLAGLSGAGFSKHSMECVRLADRQVYCYDEMWDASSAWEMETYSPVQPAQP